MGLVAGVLTVDAILLAVGYCLLAAHLRRRGVLSVVSYAGLALLVGAGATGVVVNGLVVAGARSGPVTLGVAAAVIGVLGLAVAWRRPAREEKTSDDTAWRPDWRGLLEVGCAAVLLALLALTIVAAFRTAPFLDDAWGIWVPRGLPLDHLGLDPRVFAPSFRFSTLDHPDYPLWWSLLLGLDMRFIGEVDLRATNGQSAVLVAAFFGAAARLLWGIVRPWILWPGLLLLAASPELLRQTQSGGADVPLAIYLALFVIGGGIWLARGETLGLGVAIVSGATALLVKSEGAPQLAFLAVLLAVFGWPHARGRIVRFGLAVAAAGTAASPWIVWRQTHDVGSLSDISLSNALSPSYLSDHSDRVGLAANRLAFHLTNPREWLIVVPLALVASLYVALRGRRVAWLAPAAAIVAGYAFWVWVNWADRLELSYRLGTSSYRVIDAVVLVAGISIPVLVERLLPRDVAPGAA